MREKKTSAAPFGEKESKRLSTGAVVGICCAAVALVATVVILAVALGGGNDVDTSETDMLNDLRVYEMLAETLYGSPVGMEKRTFGDASEALLAFTEEFNAMCANSDYAEYALTYQNGASMATGKQDPWGTRYYVTARAEAEDAEYSAYTFYAISAGENGSFNTATLVLDEDDTASMILKGNSVSIIVSGTELESDTSPNFGVDEIIDAKGDEATTEQEQIAEDVSDGTLPYRVRIYFNKQEGTGGKDSVQVKNGEPMSSVNITVPTRENYEFLGYFTEPGGEGTCYFDADGAGLGTIAFESDVTLYAAWSGDKVIVRFDNIGGSGWGYLTATYGKKLPAVQIPTKDGYTFLGYFSSTDGNGTQFYNSNGNALVECDFTDTPILYAYWTAQSYTVEHYVMKADGSWPTVPEYSEKKANQKDLEIRLSTLVDHSLEVANGIVYSHATVNDSLSTLATITESDEVVRLYYERCSYKVTIQNDSKTCEATGAGTYYYGQTVNLNAETGEGFSWVGWKDLSNNKVVSNSESFSFRMPAYSLNIQAVTQANSYTITLDASGGYCKTGYLTVTNGTVVTDMLPTATRSGYTFLGWGATADAKSPITTGTKYSTKGDSTYYALWEAETYTITLNAQGGRGGTNQLEVTYGKVMPSVAAVPTRDGYTFAGYYSMPNGSGVMYYDHEGLSNYIVTFTSDLVLYANWTGNDIDVVYHDQNGDEFSGILQYGSPTTVKYTETALLVDPVKKGYTFGGWYLDVNCTDVNALVTTINANHAQDGEIHLYAKWILVEYDIIYRDEGDAAFSGTLTVPYATKLSIETVKEDFTAPTREGYEFAGWYSDAACTMRFDDGTTGLPVGNDSTGTCTVYAKWESITSTIRYCDAGGAEFTGVMRSGYPTKATHGTTVALPDAYKEGYTFGGWFSDPECTQEITIVEGNAATPEICVYALWVEQAAAE